MESNPSLDSRLRSRHLPALDGLRGCSAWLVVLAHVGLLPFGFGTLGVAIFFVLSGFLITWLLLGERDSTGSISLRNFYVRRTLRIFPAFYVFWVLQVLTFKVTQQPIHGPEIAAAFFYYYDYYAGLASHFGWTLTHIMGPTWSLGVEEKFYLLWPWCFALCVGRPKLLIKIAAGIVLCTWVYRILGVSFTNLPVDYFSYAFDCRLDNIMIGCLLALLVKNGGHGRLWTALAPAPAWAFVTTLALAGMALLNGSFPRFYASIGLSISAVLIVILFVQVISWSSHALLSWLDSPVMRFFGQTSYSMYLYHWPIIFLVQYFLGGVRWKYQLIAILFGTVIAAFLSFQCIETPFLRLKRRFESGAPRRTEAGAAAR
jgi:peptidoglycan/LPS O-acetylase OafA/YrhL